MDPQFVSTDSSAHTVPLRPPGQVMRLARMGSMFQTRLSFMRSLIRRMAHEHWQFARTRFDLDEEGYGTAIYTVTTPERQYSLIAFSNYLEPDARTDRVIAEAWDATFSLFDGVPKSADVTRLQSQTPKQEAGRFRSSELTLSRANKSLRLFEHVTARLAQGLQPDPDMVAEVGYLMRTTAVYGSGKFGCSDWTRIAGRPEARTAFQIEMLTVYLIRLFSIDLIDHVARAKGGAQAVSLAPEFRRYLGIGNATGLGMAPYLVSHPVLLHQWVMARETALARVRSLQQISPDACATLQETLRLATRHIGEWQVDDLEQTQRISRLRQDLILLHDAFKRIISQDQAGMLDRLYRWGEANLTVEGQELLVSILLEPFPDLVDDLCDMQFTHQDVIWDPAMPVATLKALVEKHYDWALAIDFGDQQQNQHFWYYSEEKLEPRFGARFEEVGADKEMPLAAARDVAHFYSALRARPDDETAADFVRRHPEHRHVAKRVQTTAAFPYSEIRDNLIAGSFRPINMLRFKLAYFGASKFDPKSDLWTRITMYQGAPLPENLTDDDVDSWVYRAVPGAPQ